MTKYAKCNICGYIIAIPDDIDAGDYKCPVDGTPLEDATRTEYMVTEKSSSTFVVAASDSLHKERADYVCDGVEHELIIDDCEVAWNSRQGANVVCTADVDHQVGTFSAKMAVQAAAALGLLATHDFSALDLSDHKTIKLWIKHSLGCAAGDLVLHLSSTADCGGTPDEEEINLPALAAGVWTRVCIQLANPASDTAIISVGIDMGANDPGAFDLFIDDVKQVWDDEVEIQAAIDATVATGGLILLLGGTFYISAPIIIKNKVSIAGTGWGTKLHLVDNSDCDMFQSDPNANSGYLVLRDMDLEGNDANNTAGSAIKITTGYLHGDWYYERLLIAHWIGNGIYIESGWQHHVNGCIIEHIKGTAAFYAKPAGATSQTSVRRLYFDGSLIAGRPVGGITTNGIRLEGGNGKRLERVQITNCYILGVNTHSLFIQSVDSLVLTGSTINRYTNNAAVDAIHINDDGVLASRHIMIGNVLFGAEVWATTRHCIGVFGLSYEVGIGVNQYNTVSGEKVYFDAGVVNTGGFQQQTSDTFTDVLAASANYIVNTQNLTDGAVALTGTQPKYPRGLDCTITEVGGNVTDYTMTVVGISAKGQVITDIFTFADDGLTFSSDNAFDHITSVTLADVADTGTATFVMGIDTRLGLMNRIYETSDIWKIIKNGTKQTVAAAQVDTTYDTYDMSVITLAATDDFTIWYKSNLNIIS